MIILKHPTLSRKYRVKRRRRAISPVKPTNRFLTIAYICKAIAISLFVCIVPFLLVILPLTLIVIAVATLADKLNSFDDCLEDE